MSAGALHLRRSRHSAVALSLPWTPAQRNRRSYGQGAERNMTPRNAAPNLDDDNPGDAIDTTATPNVPAVSDATPPALVNTEPDEWSDVDDGDLAPDEGELMPALRMNRKLDGGFLMEDTGEVSSAVSFVWLAKSKSRAWWPDPFGEGEAAPTCRSNDGLKPDPESSEVQSTACATCPHAKWEQDKGQRRCVESIEAMVFMPDDIGVGRLARLRFNGIAFQPAKAWWGSFGKRGPRVPPRPALSVVTECTLEPTETKNGKFLAPKFKVAGELTRAQVAPLIEERDRRITEWQAFIARDVASRVAEADETVEDGTAAVHVEGNPEFGTEPF